MTNTTIDPTLSDDFLSLEPHTIFLSEASVAWAIEMQKDIVDLEAQWQVFIRSLAIAGFEQWLNEGALDWDGFYERSQQIPPKSVNFKVNDYRLSILPIGATSGDTVKVVVSDTQSAHLYVLIEVREEANQIHIVGGLRKEQLQHFLSDIEEMPFEEENVLAVPAAYFLESPEQILLQLSCLTPAETKDSPVSSRSSAIPLSEISTGFINARRWLQNQVETISEQLSWVLLPPTNLATEMRPVRSTVDKILETLSLQGIRLPDQAGGATSPVTVGQLTCQLYAWAWPVESSEMPEWSLFLLLGPGEDTRLPVGTKLQVSDCEGTLAQEQLSASSAVSYLYTQVQGTWPEKFWAKIVLPDGSEAMLPAFCFDSV